MLNKNQNTYVSLKKQAGATLIGMLFIGGAVMFVALIVMKVFPAYQEYYSVKTIIKSMNNGSSASMTKKEIQESFDKRANTGYVTIINGHDLTINKNDGGETVVSVQYQVIKPIFGNVSILMDFDTSADDK